MILSPIWQLRALIFYVIILCYDFKSFKRTKILSVGNKDFRFLAGALHAQFGWVRSRLLVYRKDRHSSVGNATVREIR